MSNETSIDSVVLNVPEAAQPLHAEVAGKGTRQERRWMTEDGLYLSLSVAPAEIESNLDPMSLDLVVGGSIARYRVQFGGEVHTFGAIDVPGAVDARFAYLSLHSDRGEPLELATVGALSEDRKVVALQLCWPAVGAETLRRTAASVGASLRLPA